MYVYDVNSDGRNDVITSYDAHGYGLGWFEQKADGSFTEHKIMGSTKEENAHGVKLSQIHAIRLVDVDGDGVMDLVTGKRRWAHGPSADAEPNAAPAGISIGIVGNPGTILTPGTGAPGTTTGTGGTLTTPR